MNADLARRALEKVGNPNILVNLISRRVRQLNSGGGGSSRPLLAETANMGVADIALKELVDGAMSWEMAEEGELLETKPKKGKKH